MQRPAASDRPQLGVLAQGADPGLNAAQGVAERLAHLGRRRGRQLVGRRPQRVRRAVQRRRPFRRRGHRPSGGRAARRPDRLGHLVRRRHRHGADRGTVRRIGYDELAPRAARAPYSTDELFNPVHAAVDARVPARQTRFARYRPGSRIG
jgi:hypothetical protein